MMNDHEKSDFAIVAGKPTNKAGATAAEPVEPRAGTTRNTDEQAHTGLRAGSVCPRRSDVYGKPMPSDTQGRSRMRETRSYGSVRGAAGNSRPYREPRSKAERLSRSNCLPVYPRTRTLAGAISTSEMCQKPTWQAVSCGQCWGGAPSVSPIREGRLLLLGAHVTKRRGSGALVL
jgi:hypothetical protein